MSKYFSSRSVTAVTIWGFCAGLALSTAAQASTILAGASCALTKSRVLVVTGLDGTGSATFSTVPKSRISFTTTSKGCIVVRFSAEAESGPSNNYLNIQAVLDGAIISKPADTAFAGNGTGSLPLAAHAMEYIFANVPAGSHFITVQFRSIGAGFVQLGNRTTVVQYQ